MARITYSVQLDILDSSFNGGVAYLNSSGAKDWANDLTMQTGYTAYQQSNTKNVPYNLLNVTPYSISLYTYASFKGNVYSCDNSWAYSNLTLSNPKKTLKISNKQFYSQSWTDITQAGVNAVKYGLAFIGSGKVNYANKMDVTYVIVPTVTSNAPNAHAYPKGQTIPFSWTSSATDGFAQTRCELQYKLTTSSTWVTVTGTTGSSYNLNSTMLTSGAYQWRVRVGDAQDWSGYSSTKTFTVGEMPTISNLELNQLNIDNPLILSWRSEFQSKFLIEIYQNNILKKTYAETTTRTNKTISVGDITAIGSTSFRIKVANVIGGVEYWTEFIERNFTLTRTIPRITNFTVVDTFWEKAIRTNWRAENQSKLEFEILKDNVTINRFTGNAENAFTIPKGTLTSGGAYTFRVRPIYVPTWSTTDVSYGEWVERNVTLTDIVPTVSNLTLSGSNIDLSLTLSWDSTDQSKYEIEVYKDSTRVDTSTGTTIKTLTYPHSTFTVGLHKFRIRVAYAGAGGDRWTSWQEISATLTETLPSIGVLEPDGVIVDRDNPTKVWWTSLNQSKWKLVVDDSTTYQGATETEYIIPSGTFQTGTHKMVLTVTYITPNNVEKIITKKTEFIVQGKPPIPTITSQDTFDVSRPSIVWDSSDQQGYILEVLKDNMLIYTTDWQNGLINTHMIINYLENGSYIVRVKIINQFGMESDWGSKSISINASENTTILLESKVRENSVRLIWNNTSDTFNKFYIIRNGFVIARVTGTEYTDYTCNNECTYVVRGINSRDVYKDSNSVNVGVVIKNSVVATTDKFDDMMNVGISRNEYQFGGNIGLEHSLLYLSGREYPVSVFGEHSTDTYSFKFNTRDSLFRFLDMCRRRQVFCYRDKRQTLYLTIPNPTYSIDKFGTEYSIQATQVDYSEVVSYD